jgi:hypothetical protein
MVAAVWLVAVVAGLTAMWNYASTPGNAAQAAQWPRESQLSLSAQGKTLVMFAHPHCPCTRASMAELERIVAQTNGSAESPETRITPWIVFYKPADKEAGWEQTDLWRAAQRIPGAHVLCDENAAEAKHFDAKTSGQTFVFNADGQRLFEGGITGARGHEGDNAGHSAVVQIAREGLSTCRVTPVFGCPITESSNSK